jgi:acyl carrier protein
MKNVHSESKNVTEETLLFREGILDSMGFILLIEYLENKYAIKANDEDLIEDNFESIKAIELFIQNKKTT